MQASARSTKHKSSELDVNIIFYLETFEFYPSFTYTTLTSVCWQSKFNVSSPSLALILSHSLFITFFLISTDFTVISLWNWVQLLFLPCRKMCVFSVALVLCQTMKFCHGGRAAKGSIAEMEIRMRSSSILFFFFRPVETRTVSELK